MLRFTMDIQASSALINVLLFRIESFIAFKKLYGEEIAARIANGMKEIIMRHAGDFLSDMRSFRVEKVDDAEYVVLFYGKSIDDISLPDMCALYRVVVRNELNHDVMQMLGQVLDVIVGYAQVQTNGKQDLGKLLFDAIHTAKDVARGSYGPKRLRLLDEFNEIISSCRLNVHYQPILSFRTGEIFGWEALARGPEDGPFHNPAVLFHFAEEFSSIFALEQLCRETAIKRFGPHSPDQKLFINIHPRTLVDPYFRSGKTLDFIREAGYLPEHLVLEITERHSVRDFGLFHKTLEHYKKQGFLVAIDDVGVGHSGLWSVAEIRPDFIKMDMSLVRGIDTNPVKRALMEAFVSFADKIDCRVIAEGIETRTEMSCLISIGVHYGQGYYLAKPNFPKPIVSLDFPLLKSHRTVPGRWKCSMPIQEICEDALKAAPDTKIGEIKKRLSSDEPISSIVVVDNERPIGIVMSHHLDHHLGTPFGVSLYYDRTIKHLMDKTPLIVEDNTPMEVVARQAMNRSKRKIYDHIVVTEKGRLKGIVSVQKMIDALAQVQVEVAKGANPLTGLPGNLAIEQEIEKRSQNGGPFSLIYADLDRFKMYNDLYGFTRGNQMLMVTKDILSRALRRHGAQDDFLGHVGGDDFVIITQPVHAEPVARASIRYFKRQVKTCYSREDCGRGYVVAVDRNGTHGQFPLVSISLAILDCMDSCHPDEISQRAAELKRYAKTIPGNTFVRDRRPPLGSVPDGRPPYDVV